MFNALQRMVHSCIVPGCYNRSNREMELSYFGLPLTKKKLFKIYGCTRLVKLTYQ